MAYWTPRITPYLLYQDLENALDWLNKAFGLHVRSRQDGPDGRPTHAEMELRPDGVIMLGCPGPHYQNPKRLGHVTQSLYVRVEDADRLFERALAAGALVLERPADQPYGDRRFGVADPEGHHWYFAQARSP
jgi:PhnB protein